MGTSRNKLASVAWEIALAEGGMENIWRVIGMEGLLFMLLWVGGALLHTYYDLKIKSGVRAGSDEQTDYPGW